MKYLVFSARAECGPDIVEFAQQLRAAGLPLQQVPVWPLDWPPTALGSFPDRKFELRFSQPVTVEQVREACRQVEDGHVMLQTVRPGELRTNSLRRTMSLE